MENLVAPFDLLAVCLWDRYVMKVDREVDLALLGPLGCNIQTKAGTVLNKLKSPFGETAAIIGCGAVGLRSIMAAKLTGASQIVVIDVHDSRLELTTSPSPVRH